MLSLPLFTLRGFKPISDWLFAVLVIVFSTMGSVISAHATVLVSAQLSDVQVGSTYNYTILLTNSGTESINTFWYAWIPGQNYLPTSPTNIHSPTGWSAAITHGGISDGYAIQWINSSGSALAPGSSFNQFTFDSTNTPATLAGNSPFYTSTPIGTSFVYTAQVFGNSEQFVVQSVPEPQSFALFALGLIALFALRGLRGLFPGKCK